MVKAFDPVPIERLVVELELSAFPASRFHAANMARKRSMFSPPTATCSK